MKTAFIKNDNNEKVLLIAILNCAAISLSAQAHIEVQGLVKDKAMGDPLIGVTILEVGSDRGTVTNLDGYFTISVAENSVLQVSYVGYVTQEIKVTEPTTLEIFLEQDTHVMDELVVVGYSVQKKRDILGSITKVDSDELIKTPVASAQQALQGRVAGVNVSTQTGAPGSPVSVRIRGVGSINASNEPLYIIDGIPQEGALNNLSPNEIESISVLKDASSAAIYGSRASNGVVLITTKNGVAGDAQITYNAQVGYQRHGYLTPMTNTAEYIELYNEAATADNASSVVKRELIAGDWVKEFPNVNHLEEIFRTAPLHSHELAISGGSDKTRYLVSGNLYKQEGIIRGTNFDRFTMRSNLLSDVKSWLNVSLNVSGGFSDNRLVSSSATGMPARAGASSGTPCSAIRLSGLRCSGGFVDLPSGFMAIRYITPSLEMAIAPKG